MNDNVKRDLETAGFRFGTVAEFLGLTAEEGGRVRPLIFLDIDGVLNRHDQWTNGYCGTHVENVVLLNRILAETDAVIVVSSAWRYNVLRGDMTVRGFENLLLSHGIDCHRRLIGVTCSDEDLEGRGLQIRHWLNENGGGRRYVVIDDLDLGITEQGHPFVRTDGEVGLTDRDANKAISILSGNKHDAIL